MANTQQDKKLQKDLDCLKETFYWSPGSRNVDGISKDFVKKSIIPSFIKMIESAVQISEISSSSKVKQSASDFVERVNCALKKANEAIQ